VIRAFVVIGLSAALVASPSPARAAPAYLAPGSVDLRGFIPPPPVAGSPGDERDRQVFRDGRPAVGSPRWIAATADADEAVPSILRDFSAAVGIALTPRRFPRLARMLTTMRPDLGAAVDMVKPLYARPRPFLRDAGPVCQDKALLARSFDYPSGHTVWGTAVALVLTELWPRRADAILARGRDYGESRFVCGAHSVSAVEAGRQAAGALVAALHGSPRFRRDLEAVRREVRRRPSE
jgi:acid phosphatase (class A)